MKDMIISKKTQENKRQLVMRNASKIVLVEFIRTSSPMDLDGKYM